METKFRPRRDFQALESRRLEATKYFEQGEPQSEIVRHFHISRQTASRWYWVWHKQGKDGLKAAGRAGRKPRLDFKAQKQLANALLKGPTAWGFSTNLWTMERVNMVIRKICKVNYHPRHIGRILHAIGWSRQRPARRAKERDEKAIAQWVNIRWPEVKKTLQN